MREQLGASVGCNGLAETSDILQTANIQYTVYRVCIVVGGLPEGRGDPAIFVIELQDASKKLIFNTIFSACYFLKVPLHYFSKIKSQKESQNSRIQDFSYYFCMMIEGSGSGSIHLSSGSESRRPKNTWIR
jgi:hypothetical protein